MFFYFIRYKPITYSNELQSYVQKIAPFYAKLPGLYEECQKLQSNCFLFLKTTCFVRKELVNMSCNGSIK